jgi:hypothetical protein
LAVDKDSIKLIEDVSSSLHPPTTHTAIEPLANLASFPHRSSTDPERSPLPSATLPPSSRTRPSPASPSSQARNSPVSQTLKRKRKHLPPSSSFYSQLTRLRLYSVGMTNDVPFLLETELKALGGKYEKAAEPWASHVVVDGNLYTGQNPASAGPLAEKIKKDLLA